MRILLTGATGQLGREFCRSRLPSGASLIAASRTQLDLTRIEAFDRFFDEVRPDLLINTAAYTAVEQAETNPDLAFAINSEGAGALAQAAAARRIPIVHISTDYVFDGEKQEAWSEEDQPSPINVYGQSKRAGEIAVAAANPHHLIIRVSWLYAAHGNNFLRIMLRLGRQHSKLTIVNDQTGRPTAAADLADTALLMALQAMKKDGLWGLYHFSNSGEPVSRHGFACEIFRRAAPWFDACPLVDPISTKDLGAPARRPRNSVLALNKIGSVFGVNPRPWQEALANVLEELRLENVEKTS